ncbi:MAG: DUF5671 domain-containing protein [Chloroflexota bacterium]
MQAVRRIYLYAMSGVALAVVAVGLSTLLEVLLDALGLTHGPANYGGSGSREQLSLAIALVLAGFPVWAIHWWVVQRGLDPRREDTEAERGSAVRALYFSIVLGVALIAWATGIVEFMQWVAARITSAPPDAVWADPVSSLARTIVAVAAWVFHGFVRRDDLARGPVRGAAAWLPRVYLYGAGLVGLVVALGSVGNAVSVLFQETTTEYGYGYPFVPGPLVQILVWGLVWILHWRYTAGVASGSEWRASDELVSRTRLAAFAATIIVAAAFVIGGLAGAASGIIGPLIATGAAYADATSRSQAQAILAPLATAIVWLIAWWAYERWLRREPAAADPVRRLDQVRLTTHGVSAVALAFGATATGWLIGLVIDIVFGGSRTVLAPDGAGYWRAELANWLPMAILGMAVWLWRWSSVLGRRTSDPEGEAGSTIRRAFLYLTVGVALVAVIGSAALIVYRLVGIIVGADLSGDVVSELSTPIGALVAASAFLAYHGLALRADMALRVRASESVAVAGQDGGPSAAPARFEAAETAIGLRQVDIVIDCTDHEVVVPFWEAALGWERRDVNEQYVSLAPPADQRSGDGPRPLSLLFQKVPEPKAGKNRVHLDWRSADRPAEVARLVALGATEGPTRNLGSLTWTVMEDPEGNEFCVQ